LDNDSFKIIKCKGDGNCMFRATAVHIFKSQSKHYLIRRVVASYIKEHKDSFIDFIDENFEEYIMRLQHNRAWAGDVELQAISEIYAKKIEVYMKDEKTKQIYFSKSFHESISGVGEPLRLLYTNGHYDSIIMQNSSSKSNCINKKYHYEYYRKGKYKRKIPLHF